MSRSTILAVAAGAALIAFAVYFFGQSLFERGENVRVVRTKSNVVAEDPRGVAREVRTEILPTQPGDEGRAARRDEEEKKAERE